MTETIQKVAKGFVGDDYEVVTKRTREAPAFIGSYVDNTKAGPGMLELLLENQKEHDAFIIACHGDPNLEAMKELTRKPVIGIGEASIKLASMLGHSFSILTPLSSIIPSKIEQVRKCHMEDQLASIRVVKGEGDGSLKERLLEAGRLAVEEDGAKVIVLGCAAYGGLEGCLSEQFDVPVIEGIVSALIIAQGLVKYGIKRSRD